MLHGTCPPGVSGGAGPPRSVGRGAASGGRTDAMSWGSDEPSG
ncbi:hypothetical protein KCH_20290 [Kitasatospora cheerisanensis KCTC 2395]|uniref:Uncharacterized protein n=1 Tax=Kitasatospora cheerisanensis KCTC 2395 TaxID=1348663 RepID=A0A066YYD7_9ACTN|nr:hypothetical protein KCH_20290 [Kitasatospora cheerisanensis KCTC 2395]